MKRRRNAAGPSQKDLYYGTVRKQGDADALFMDFVREGMTREELAANIKRRPALWGRYSSFLSKLPSSKRNPRRYRRNSRTSRRRYNRGKLRSLYRGAERAGFASRAQQRWAFGTGQSFARKWARKTKFKGLPERATNMRRHRRNAKYAYDVIAGSRKRPQGWVGTYRTAQEARREGTRKGYSFYVKRIVKSNSRLSKLARSARKRVAIKRMLRRAGHRIPAGIMFRTGALRKYRRRKLGYNARDPVAYRRGRAVGHLSHSASYPAPSPRAMRMYGASFVAGFKKGKTRRSRR